MSVIIIIIITYRMISNPMISPVLLRIQWCFLSLLYLSWEDNGNVSMKVGYPPSQTTT